MSWLTSLLGLRKKAKRLTLGAPSLFSEIERQHANLMDADCCIRLGDREYVSLSEQEAFVAISSVVTVYRPETSDCDDFAVMAKAEVIRRQRRGDYDGKVAAFGQVWLSRHAINFYLHHDGGIRFINNDGLPYDLRLLRGEITLLLA